MNDFQQIFIDQPSIDAIADDNLPISFVVHGFLASIQGSRKLITAPISRCISKQLNACTHTHTHSFAKWLAWMERMARIWSIQQRRIVCLVDWQRLAAFDYGTASLKHTQTVGLYMAKLIGSLPSSRSKGISIVGHSLGAHVAGYCGSALNGSIQFIYGKLSISFFATSIRFWPHVSVSELILVCAGLDPAGPLFTIPVLADLDRRLDASDAQHVQCLHTDRGVAGTSNTCGDSDYFANMGYRQPGCFLHVCSHIRAVYIFEASLHRSNAFMGRKCADDQRAYNNLCYAEVDRFGIHGNHSNGLFYFRTTDCYPYCWNCTWSIPA